MTTPDETSAIRKAAHAELEAAVAALTVTYQCAAGEVGEIGAATMVYGLAENTFPDDPARFVWPVAFVAVRALSMAAQVLEVTVPDMLSQLGLEVATLDPLS